MISQGIKTDYCQKHNLDDQMESEMVEGGMWELGMELLCEPPEIKTE